MSKKPKQYDDDDGHTIVNMDVPGMSWHQEHNPADLRTGSSDTDLNRSALPNVELTRKEWRQITGSAVLAGLTIAAVYAVVWVLFTLFATQIWLK